MGVPLPHLGTIRGEPGAAGDEPIAGGVSRLGPGWGHIAARCGVVRVVREADVREIWADRPKPHVRLQHAVIGSRPVAMPVDLVGRGRGLGGGRGPGGAALLAREFPADRMIDKGLAWGAKASDYARNSARPSIGGSGRS